MIETATIQPETVLTSKASKARRDAIRLYQRRLAVPLLLASSVSACVAPTGYRVEGGQILQPHTREITERGEALVAVDILADLPRSAECRRPVPTRKLSARRISFFVDGRAVNATRFVGPSATFANSDALRDGFNDWVQAQPNSCGFAAAKQPMIISNLLAQRPLAIGEAIFEWYGAGAGDDATRAVVLRPGMRVCVSDASSADSFDTGYALAGESCARLISAPGGPVFDPVASRFTTPLTPRPGGADNHLRTVWSWSEITYETRWEQRAFVVVQPKGMPSMPQSQVKVGNYSLLVMADPTTTIRVADISGGGRDFPAVAGIVAATATDGEVTKLCERKNNEVRCIRFGERGVFRVDLPITLNSKPFDVPVGTTLSGIAGLLGGDFAASIFVAPPKLEDDTIAEDRRRRAYARINLLRWFDGRRHRVALPTDPGDLPLQPGDQISW